jgi:transcriptional regulator with XRE-family HTH domain
MVAVRHSFGDLLKSWRRSRGFSQLELATDANVSQKHVSFIESGRTAPSRDMVLLLAEHLEIPLRERNALLLAAGFAPAFHEKRLDDASLAEARKAIELIIHSHEPFPALAIDRHWNMVVANSAVMRLIDGVQSQLLNPPINVIRLSLDPHGLAPRILNLHEWRAHLLERLRRQHRLTRDARIEALLREFDHPRSLEGAARSINHGSSDVLMPLRLATSNGVLNFFTTTTIFGTPTEITLSELSLEAFYPADATTAEALTCMMRK